MELKACLVICDFPECAKMFSFSPTDPVPLKCCSGCKYMYYCNRECQQKHWSFHKTECKTLVPHSYRSEITKVEQYKPKPSGTILIEQLPHPIVTGMKLSAMPFSFYISSLQNVSGVISIVNRALVQKIEELQITQAHIYAVRGIVLICY